MALQTSVNRRSSLRSSSERRPGSFFSGVVGVEVLDGLLEAVALDEPHGVIRAAVGVGAQPVDRDDAGVLQPAGDLGLHEEPLAAGRVVGVVVEDLLERDLAVQLAIQRHEHRPQPAPGVRPEDAEPLAVAGRRADGVGGREVRIAVFGRAVPGGHMAERPLDIRVAEPGQTFAGRLAGRHGGEALLDVAVLLDVQGDDRVEAGAGVGVEVAPGDELVGQALGLCRGSRPGRRRRAGPGRSARSEERAIRTGDGGPRRRSWRGSDRRRSIGRRPQPLSAVHVLSPDSAHRTSSFTCQELGYSHSRQDFQ